ncbi:MAG: sporulation protein YtxC [Christensenellales bacterium]|jgi:hypothetical protein
MQLVIGSLLAADTLKDLAVQAARRLENPRVRLGEAPGYPGHFVRLEAVHIREEQPGLDVLVQLVTEDFLRLYLGRYIQRQQPELSLAAANLMAYQIPFGNYRIYWQHAAQLALADYIAQRQPLLMLDGFMRFRLGHMVTQAQYLAQAAIMSRKTREEYDALVDLLQRYVSAQRHPARHLTLYLDPEEAHLVDEMGQDRVLRPQDFPEGAICYEDALMDYLVTLAPQRIVLCYRGGSINPRMVDTLRRIFPNRVQEMRLTPSQTP